jgi:eukaryotic-like serine/threonine-protein kinase
LYQGTVSELGVLRLKTFGSLSIDGGHGSFRGAAAQPGGLAVLALLAAAREHGLTRDKLLGYLWPERDEEHGRHALAQALHALRRDLRDDVLFLGTTELRLNPARITSDLEEFEAALERHEVERAVGLYTGPFLDGFYRSGAPEFERWVETQRGRLKQRACEALETLATEAAARADHRASAAWWRRVAALDPLNARIARELMGALVVAGDRAAALQHARVHEALLRQELDVEPDAVVTDLVRRLRAIPEPGPQTDAVEGGRPQKPVSGDIAPRPRRRIVRRLAIGTALAAAAGALYFHFKPDTALDPDLLAVAPFDVLAPNAELWREGLVDVLSRNLDGAGPTRTVSPSVVIRRWTGRADRASAGVLGGQTGAGLVVFGRLVSAGQDSVRLTADLLDTRKGRTIVQVDRTDLADRIDRLADSLSLDVIRALTPPTSGTHIRLFSAGTNSLPALKAFLQGERFLRRFSLDSAIASYDRAVAQDSTFALALVRLDLALGWNDSARSGLIARAVALGHGLTPRDSLLIATDTAGFLRRYAILLEAARRYPEDPEIWYTLGEARFHGGFFVGSSWNDARAAFDRAITLDSGFAPAYIHPVEIALNDNDPGAALRYVRSYLDLSSAIREAGGIRLLNQLLDPQRPRPQDFDRELETASPPELYHLALAVQTWPDADETQIQVARRAVEIARARLAGAPADTGNDLRVFFAMLPSTLIYRGHLQEARRLVGNRFGRPFMELAELGVVPRGTVDTVVARWFHHSGGRGFTFIPWFADGPCHRTLDAALWWAARRDTASLRRLVRREESEFRAGSNVALAGDARPVPGFARAALALAQGDTTLALSRFLAFPDSLCPGAPQLPVVRFRLLAAVGRSPDAAAVFDRSHDRRVPILLERARLAERLGDHPTAVHYYRFVLQAWQHADLELQPVVADARTALQRLSGGPR